jgi:Cu-Zn family superoxide dismutase
MQEIAMTRNARFALIAASAVAFAACNQNQTEPPADNGMADDGMPMDNAMATDNGMAPGAGAMTAQLMDAAGTAVGEVKVTTDASGATFIVTTTGMATGARGLHLHAKGLCEGPKFESAGSHWNPGAKQHGKDNPSGAHLGDLDNIDGASATVTVAGVSASGGANSLADADGTSLVIHAKADDYKTDPSGNSGDRVACAVLAAPK